MTNRPVKRRRLSGSAPDSTSDAGPSRAAPTSYTAPISPPGKGKQRGTEAAAERRLVSSPFRLTKIRDLSARDNVGAVSLSDLVGDPLISECWEFNFQHDIDFLMRHFDDDTRDLIRVHVIHGFWKREDPDRQDLQDQASRYDNVKLHAAYQEMFGTHHSKMLILFRHDGTGPDGTAQVIIHTANMIAKDWTNMTNGVWQSPYLPVLKSQDPDTGCDAVMGSGSKFKMDLLNYLRAYNNKYDICRPLVEKLGRYDFSAVRGALVASVPGTHHVSGEQGPGETRWGWAALKEVLRSVPTQAGKSQIVTQMSSIATLGPTEKWLKGTLFDAMFSTSDSTLEPSFKVVFPTADEIRRSLDGYMSGGSILTRIESDQQKKQLQYLKPRYCHWANDSPAGLSLEGEIREAGRQRAAPHIKTYIRYGEDKSIDWALMTSANMSKQAWGEAASPIRQFRVASWEIGVLVWPELLAGPGAKMVGTFKRDTPTGEEIRSDRPLVGLRIPYNLPLQGYGSEEIPWVTWATHREPDWMGNTWPPG